METDPPQDDATPRNDGDDGAGPSGVNAMRTGNTPADNIAAAARRKATADWALMKQKTIDELRRIEEEEQHEIDENL